jgi:glycerol-3-phosphate acyltransferase PlsY
MQGLYIQLFFIVVSYIIGSIPWALIVGKLVKGIDIREHGSKNMGATNTFRVLGFKWGLLVFALDAIKGGIILFIMKHNFFGFDLQPVDLNFITIPVFNPLIYGAFAFLGHLFPVFAKFKGGKGMATAAGVILFYHPIAFACGLITFLIVIIISRFVSLSSVVTGIAVLIATILWNKDIYLIIILIFINIFLIIKHIPNFKRIINHTESKINFKAINDPNLPAFISDDDEQTQNKK